MKETMEPHDFDNLIKSRIQQTNDIYQKEMDAVKPFVWSAIQNNLRNTGHVKGWHLVAAVMAILIMFSLVFYSSQQKHQRDLDLVYTKMDQLQEHYNIQTNLLRTREIQLDSVADQLDQVVLYLEHQSQHPPTGPTISKVDTVFIRQIEYVTVGPKLELPKESAPEKSAPLSAIVQNSIPHENEIDHAIFPIRKSSINNQKEEPIKVKLGSFTARKD